MFKVFHVDKNFNYNKVHDMMQVLKENGTNVHGIYVRENDCVNLNTETTCSLENENDLVEFGKKAIAPSTPGMEVVLVTVGSRELNGGGWTKEVKELLSRTTIILILHCACSVNALADYLGVDFAPLPQNFRDLR